MYTSLTFVQMRFILICKRRVFFKQSRKLHYFPTARFVLFWTAPENFLLLLSEFIYQNVFNYTIVIKGYECKDPSVRVSATIINTFLTLKQHFG